METQQGDISIKTTLNCNFFSENPWGCLQAVIRVLWVTHKGNSRTDKMKDTRRWNGDEERQLWGRTEICMFFGPIGWAGWHLQKIFSIRGWFWL